MFLIWYLNTQVPTDLAFLDVSKYDIDLRISFLNSFLSIALNRPNYYLLTV